MRGVNQITELINDLLDIGRIEAGVDMDMESCDALLAAIDLFDDYVRKAEASTDDAQAITETFRRLLPQVTRLVALHFQRTLVNRALERLRARGGGKELEAALAAVESSNLEVSWR